MELGYQVYNPTTFALYKIIIALCSLAVMINGQIF